MDYKTNFYDFDFEEDIDENVNNVWINLWEVYSVNDQEEKSLYKICNKFSNVEKLIFLNYGNISNLSKLEDILDGFDNVLMLEK